MVSEVSTINTLADYLTKGGYKPSAATTYKADLAFRRETNRFVWITDSGKKVGLIDQGKGSIEWIAVHPHLASQCRTELPELYHAPSYQGGRILPQWWLSRIGGWRTDPTEPMSPDCNFKPQITWNYSDKHGEQLELELIQNYSMDVDLHGKQKLIFSYDNELDCYIIESDATLDSTTEYYAECCNLYAGGIYDTRPDHKRYQHTIWSHPEGDLIRWAHNPVSYMAPGMNEPRGQRRISEGGFIGYITEPDTNPIVEVLESTHAMTAATCNNLYDEHIICLPEEPFATGHFNWRVKYRLISITSQAAEILAKQTRSIDLKIDPIHRNPVLNETKWQMRDLTSRLVYSPEFPAFYYGQVNDFAKPIPYESVVAGSFFWASQCPQHDVYWDRVIGRTTPGSLRLRNSDVTQSTFTTTSGPTPHVTPNTYYRFSAWVKCVGGKDVQAFMRFDEIALHTDSVISSTRTNSVADTGEWTLIQCELQTQNHSEIGMPYLELEGIGEAWFDEVLFEEI